MEESISIIEQSKRNTRKGLIPKWIKVFGWIFIVMGASALLFYMSALIIGFSGSYSLFGLSYEGTAYAIKPAVISALLLANGIAAYGLIFTQRWGVKVCLVMGYLGLALSLYTSISSLFNFIQFEPVFQIPYLYTLHKMKIEWEQ